MHSSGTLHENVSKNISKNVLSGQGSLSHLDSIIEKESYQRILLFTDTTGFRLSGAADHFKRLEAKSHITKTKEITYEGKALPIEDIEELYIEAKTEPRVDVIIAVGGGTIIDVAKVISIAYSNRCEKAEEVLDNKTLENKIPLIFIPTTAGTGSETTSFAVVYRNRVKISVVSSSLLPHYIILEPLLLQSLPESVLHATVLDALAQATESIWAVGGTEESRGYAGRAVALILENVYKEASILRLSGLQLGSYWAGKAINISKTTLSHSISYPITAYFGVPHGIAVFLTLPDVADLNYHATAGNKQDKIEIEQIKERFSFMFSLYGVESIHELKQKLKEVMVGLKVKARLRDYGITGEDLSLIAANALTKGRSDNNPRKMSREDILELLQKIF